MTASLQGTFGGQPAQRGLAFASYRAALDREDQAARVKSIVAARIRDSRGDGHV